MMAATAAEYEQRLVHLREELRRQGFDGFIVPMNDEHMSEYGGDYALRLAWLTGFRGSAGVAVVLQDKAAIFVDGRYTLEVRREVDGQHWAFQPAAHTNMAAWLSENVAAGARVGYDPWLHTKRWVVEMRSALVTVGATLRAANSNPIDAIWADRPGAPNALVSVHPHALAGKTAIEKRDEITEWLVSRHADVTVVCALDSIAWAFNLRGADFDHTPVVLANAIFCADGSADLFIAPQALTPAVMSHLGPGVRIHTRDSFAAHLATLTGKTVAVDPNRTVSAVSDALAAAGAKVLGERDPVVSRKAIKNETEIAGHKAAHVRDGTALCEFLHWLSVEAPKGGVSELSAAAQLRRFREATGHLQGLSFETISAGGPNSSVIHYHPTEKTSRALELGTLYLVDSGGQYLDGTTDVSRTIAIGEPTGEMKDRFTRALKGHIALANAVFPEGTRGSQLDVLARQYLWEGGFDYSHGTSHGVGSFLCVHEGPQRIAKTVIQGVDDDPLVAGMILSNEPGYYKPEAYGLRFENLMLVVKREVGGAERPMLGFDTLTLAPIERALIDVGMLTPKERSWIDDYHAAVAATIAPRLGGAARQWLMRTTRPLD